MVPLKQPPARLNYSSSKPNPVESEKPQVSSKHVARLTALVLGMAVVFCSPSNTRVLAKTGQAADAKPATAIDPDAMEALNKMGTYLRSLKAFQVDSESSNDDVLDDGEIITDTRSSTLLAVAPNLLRAELKGDDRNTFLFYDGKNFTVYGKLVNYYATVPAPPTIRELVDKVDSEYGIEIPLADLFKWGTDESTIKKITSAIDVGPSSVQGITCEHYAFRQEGIDWQIWIQLGDFPLPKKFVIRTLTDDARPQHTSTLTWNLAPSYNEAAFTFDPPQGAERIPLKDLNADTTKNAQ
jgi:hypothetical protein